MCNVYTSIYIIIEYDNKKNIPTIKCQILFQIKINKKRYKEKFAG